jgi:hypothetical protein
MRTALLVVVSVCGACGGAAMSANDAGIWWQTCGAPACNLDAGVPDSGLPSCSPALAGAACPTLGEECDPRTGCNVYLLCATSDPRDGGCPISRARFKRDIRFLSGEELRGYSRELLDLPLATFRYRAGDERTHLGFMIDGHESLACVDGDHVDLYGYASMAVAALKVQAEDIAALREDVAALRKELAIRRR